MHRFCRSLVQYLLGDLVGLQSRAWGGKMRVVVHPVPVGERSRAPAIWKRWRLTALPSFVGAFLLAVVIPYSQRSSSIAVPVKGATSPPISWLQNATLLSAYGRAFGTEPILGRLGEDRSIDDVARQLDAPALAIKMNTG